MKYTIPKISINKIYEAPMPLKAVMMAMMFMVVIYLGYMWDISSLNARLALAKKNEQDIKDQYEFVVQKEEQIKKEVTLFPKYKTVFTNWQKRLIFSNQLPELMNDIIKSGENNHLYFSLITPGENTKESVYLKSAIKIIVVGSYHEISDFISQVANMQYIVKIGDFLFSTENKNDVLGAKLAQQANEQNLLTAQIILEVYQLAQ